MFSNTLLRTALLLAILPVLGPELYARNVYVMPPNDGATRTVTVFSANDLNRLGTIQAATDAYTALTMPNGNKTYIIGRGATNTVTVVNNANLQVSSTINVPTGSSTAAITPDGRRVVLLGNNSPTMTFIDTGTDVVLNSVNLPGTGNSLVIAPDSSRAYALLGAVSIVVSVDAFSYQVNSLSLPSQSADQCGMGMAPNGFLYANAQNRLYEIDPRTFTVNLSTSSQYNGTGGTPEFTPDGTKAVFPIVNTAAGASVMIVELRRSSVIGSGLNLQGLRIDRLKVTSATSAIGYSQGGGQVYTFNLLSPYSASPSGFSGLPTSSLTGGLAVSAEAPNAAFLFTAQGSTLFRVNLVSNSVSNQSLANNAGPVVYSGPASTSPPAQMFAFNTPQIVGPTAVLAPLIVKVVDAAGLPVVGAPITFTSTNIFNAQPNPASAVTNGEGIALTSVANPNITAGQFTVQASTTGQITQVFSIVIGAVDGGGGTGGGTGSGKLEIWDGNGLFAKSLAPTLQDMVVRVSDANGNPVPGVVVNWSITSSGGGSLNQQTSTTNENGLATNRMIGKLMFGALQSFEAASVTASTNSGTVTFSVIQIPRLIDGSSSSTQGERLAPDPIVNQIFPDEFTRPQIIGPVGGVLKGAFRYRIRAATGPFLGIPIPGVGVSGNTGLTRDLGPVVTCDPNLLSDADGVVTCDLRFDAKSKLGEVDPFTITVGGLSPLTYPLRMIPGPPSKIEKVLNLQGQDPDNQTGAPGVELPRQLVARLADIAGNLSTGAEVRWEVVSGSATLFGTVNRADARGLVSTGVRLGNIPGPVRIRVSVPSQPSVTPLVFTATVEVAVGAFTKISGDGQQATVNSAFDQPLVVEVRDGQNRVVQGAVVTVTSTGDVRVPGSVTTDANGRASITANAGSSPGNATVTATIAGFSQAFSLSVRPLAPTLTSVINNASGRVDGSIAPCSQVNINGTNIVPGLTGLRSSQNQFGRLPTTFEGVTVRINGNASPIFWVFGGGGSRPDTVAIQVPCGELQTGTANIEVSSGSLAPGALTVRVTPVAPGIFEDGEGTARQAIVLRPNGTRASSSNPAQAGERVTILATGLGLVSPGTATNEPGTGNQRALADIVIGLNNEGISGTETEYAPGLLGVYYVSFTIPTDATRGPNRPLVIAASGADGNIVFSAATTMDIR